MKLIEALTNRSLEDLRLLAKRHGLGETDISRNQLISDLEYYLTRIGAVDRTLKNLGRQERQALDALVAEGGSMPEQAFSMEHGIIVDAGRGPYGYNYGIQQPAAPPRSPADVLWRNGLIGREYQRDQDGGEVMVTIPAEILEHLPAVHKSPFAEQLQQAQEPSHVVVSGDLVRDVGMLLCYVAREPVRVVRGDQLAKRDLLKLNEDMSVRQQLEQVRIEGDATWINFVHHLATLQGLLRVDGALMSVSDKAEDWLRLPYERQLTELWRHFLKDGSWDDVKESVSASFVQSYPIPPHVVASRSRVVEALKNCAPGVWYSVDSFERAMRSHYPLFLRSRARQPYGWSSAYFYGEWQQIEGRLIAYLLARVLNWFGVVRAGASTDGKELVAFQLTPSGAILLGMSEGGIAAPPATPIVIQPNFEIVVPRETSPAVLFYLQQVAKAKKRDLASIYLLDQEAVWRSLQRGSDIERIISFLQRASERALPQNVAYSLREWAGKHGQLTIERATLLEAASDALMAEVLANRKLAVKVKRRLSGSAIAVDDSTAPALVEQLKKAGYWPKAAADVAVPLRSGEAGRSTITLKSSELVHLLAAAIVLNVVAEERGSASPVSSALLRNLSWQLPPALLSSVERMANDALARLESANGTAADDDEGHVE